MTNLIDTPSRRKKLAVRREPYWQKITTGRYLGFRRTESGGAWIARLRDDYGRQRYESLGDALSYDEAVEKAMQWFALAASVEDHHYRVKDAVDDYIDHLRVNNSETTSRDTRQRLDKHLTDKLSNTELTKIRTAQIKRWHQGLVRLSEDEEDVRRSRDGANKLLAKLKAALNLAFGSGLVATDREWRRVKPFRNAGAARTLFLTDEQVKRLLENTSGGFHALVKVAVLTGARYGELAAVHVRDFDPARGILALTGKTGPRECYLSNDTMTFLKQQARDKLPAALLFARDDGDQWGKSHQSRPMKAAIRAAKLPRDAVFYSLRHYHISKALLAGIPAQVIAENTGTSVRMLEQHYGKFLEQDRRAMLNKVALL